MTKQEMIDLIEKIDYEGGLPEYLFGYGDANSFKPCGEVIHKAAQEAEIAFINFKDALDDLREELGVEPL